MNIARTWRSRIRPARLPENAALIACILLALAAPLGMPGRSHASPAPVSAEKLVHRHILPSYRNLAASADGMVEALKNFCAMPDGGTKAGVDKSFRALALAWARIEHIRFGPVTADNIYDKIHFWPDRKGIGRRQIERAVKSADRDVLDRRQLRKKSAAMQGIGALEHLLYGRAADRLAAGSAEGSFRCRFALAIAGNVSAMAGNEILPPWSGNKGFAAHFLHPGPNNPVYLTEKELFTEIVKTYLNGLYIVRDVRLAGPLGMKPGRKKKSRAAHEKSGLSMLALRANIEGLRKFFLSSGLAAWIAALEPGLDRSVLAELDLAIAHANAIPLSLENAVARPAFKSKLISMGFPLKNARDQVLQTLTKHTDLPLGINALDGD